MRHRIKKIFKTVGAWLQPSYKTVFTEDFPENIERQNIYIVGTKKYPWQAAFKCPCGCMATIQLSLLPEDRPCWKYKLDNKKLITLSPSIWRKVGCKSHFFIRKGKVAWARDY